MQGSITGFLKSLGFPELREHQPFNHFDFARPSRRILVIGPMGSGKTEYSSRVWRDSQVVLRKSSRVSQATRTGDADRRNVFFIRSTLDRQRFPDYPQDALPFRGGYERCGDRIADIESSFDLERLFEKHPEIGTWIIDEAAFYEERLAYIVNHESESRGLIFIFPTLILNFRREIFNSTARLLLEMTTDPLIIVGGDREKRDPREPNYCSRCDEHHHLPGKEYTYLILKPLGEEAARSNLKPLREELANLARRMEASRLYSHFKERYAESDLEETMMSSLRVPCIAEKALIFLYAEQNLVSRTQMEQLMGELTLDREFIRMRLRDNGRSLA